MVSNHFLMIWVLIFGFFISFSNGDVYITQLNASSDVNSSPQEVLLFRHLCTSNCVFPDFQVVVHYFASPFPWFLLYPLPDPKLNVIAHQQRLDLKSSERVISPIISHLSSVWFVTNEIATSQAVVHRITWDSWTPKLFSVQMSFEADQIYFASLPNYVAALWNSLTDNITSDVHVEVLLIDQKHQTQCSFQIIAETNFTKFEIIAAASIQQNDNDILMVSFNPSNQLLLFQQVWIEPHRCQQNLHKSKLIELKMDRLLETPCHVETSVSVNAQIYLVCRNAIISYNLNTFDVLRLQFEFVKDMTAMVPMSDRFAYISNRERPVFGIFGGGDLIDRNKTVDFSHNNNRHTKKNNRTPPKKSPTHLISGSVDVMQVELPREYNPLTNLYYSKQSHQAVWSGWNGTHLYFAIQADAARCGKVSSFKENFRELNISGFKYKPSVAAGSALDAYLKERFDFFEKSEIREEIDDLKIIGTELVVPKMIFRYPNLAWTHKVCTACEIKNPFDPDCSGVGDCFNFSVDHVFHKSVCHCDVMYEGELCHGPNTTFQWFLWASTASAIAVLIMYCVSYQRYIRLDSDTTKHTDVLQAEERHVLWRRENLGIPTDAPLVGIACSGGGIRSAAIQSGLVRAVNSGIPEGFARVDYLASVSGGGFTCTSLLNHIAAETNVADKSTPSGWRNTIRLAVRKTINQMHENACYLLRVPEKHSFKGWGLLLFDVMKLATILLFGFGVLFVQILVVALPLSYLFVDLNLPSVKVTAALYRQGICSGLGCWEDLLWSARGSKPLWISAVLFGGWMLLHFVHGMSKFFPDGHRIRFHVDRGLHALNFLIQILALYFCGLFAIFIGTTAPIVNEKTSVSALVSVFLSIALAIFIFFLILFWGFHLVAEHFLGKLVGWCVLIGTCSGLCWYLSRTCQLDDIDERITPDISTSFLHLFAAGFMSQKLDDLRAGLHRFYREQLASAFYVEDIPLHQLIDNPYIPVFFACATANGVKKHQHSIFDFHIFTMSPWFCGSSEFGYHSTREHHQDFYLGEAMTISGAALAYAMGAFHQVRKDLHALSSYPVLGLGKWFPWAAVRFRWPRYVEVGSFVFFFILIFIGSHLKQSWLDETATFAMVLMVALGFLMPELGYYSTMIRYLHQMYGVPITVNNPSQIFLSDGGHSENLAFQELLHRRCDYIIVGNGGHDFLRDAHSLLAVIRKSKQAALIGASTVDLGGGQVVDIETFFAGPWKRLSKYMDGAVVIDFEYLNPDGTIQKKGRILYVQPPSVLSEELKKELESIEPQQGKFAMTFDASEELGHLPGFTKKIIGDFPHHHTHHQFFSPQLFANYSLLAYCMTRKGIREFAQVDSKKKWFPSLNN